MPYRAHKNNTATINTQTKAEYKRKAAILLELMAAQRSSEGGAASEAFMQQLAAFRVDVDEAMLHMLRKRLHAAAEHQEVCVCVLGGGELSHSSSCSCCSCWQQLVDGVFWAVHLT